MRGRRRRAALAERVHRRRGWFATVLGQALAGRYGIQSIPTVAVFVDGEAVTGFVGAHPAATIGQFLDATIAEHARSVRAV